MSFVFGGFIAYVSQEFAEEWVITILGVWIGIVFAVCLLKATLVKKATIELIVALIYGVIGGYIGKTCEKFVKCFITAFVGAFLFAYGLAFYLNNYPSLDVNKDSLDPWIFVYFGI